MPCDLTPRQLPRRSPNHRSAGNLHWTSVVSGVLGSDCLLRTLLAKPGSNSLNLAKRFFLVLQIRI